MLQATGIHVASKGIAARRTTLVPLLRSINYSYPARNNLVLAGQRRHASSTPDGDVLSDVGPALQEISASTAPSTSVLLLALFGLPLALWSYKCLMMVLFQRKIIYMGYIPPGARSETLDVNDPLLSGLKAEKIVVQSDPGVQLEGFMLRRLASSLGKAPSRRVAIIYFQGNVGSPIQRLPLFRKLCLAGESSHGLDHELEVELIAVPPRSYGLSTNVRPNQRALLSDYSNVVRHVTQKYTELDKRDSRQTKIVWYGHSLGASIATCLLSTVSEDEMRERRMVCDGLIFENGFASIKGMVRTLYPQRFLPYYWLTPFVMDDWNALDTFGYCATDSILNSTPKLFVASEKDEMVPTGMVKRVYERAVDHVQPGTPCEWLGIKDALHDFAYQKPSWAKGLWDFVSRLHTKPSSSRYESTE